MSLLRLRIKGRLYAGFATLVLFGVALASFAVWQLSAIEGEVGRMTRISDNTIVVLEISTELQAVRRAILRYNFDHDKPSFAEADKRSQPAASAAATCTASMAPPAGASRPW